jgi:serine/threonine protein kinase/putative intracellular protease/amidase
VKNVAPQPHPSYPELHAFAQGFMQDAEFAAIEEHLYTCDQCCAWIAAQPENTLVALAREVATLGGPLDRQRSPVIPERIPAALEQHPRYRVIEMIGTGGMGAVYKAEHRLMQRLVALKVVHPKLLSNPEAVERFQREVRLAARLAHRHIVISYDADQADDLHFLVMEFVSGQMLSQKIAATGPASIRQACEWVRQAALGLQHAYEQGMAHRDIKPHNLIIAKDGHLRILDFGLSRLLSDQAHQPLGSDDSSAIASQTQAGAIIGTPDYMAPEQILSAREADIRADIYSLGCTLFFLLSGRPPFSRNSVSDTLQAHIHAAIPNLQHVREDAPAELNRLLARMLAKSPQDRFQTPGELAQELSGLLRTWDDTPSPDDVRGGGPVPPTGLTHQPLRRSQVDRRALVSGLLTLAGLIGLAAWLGNANMFSPWSQVQRVRLLVLLPSDGLWYPDYAGLVDAAQTTGVQLTFASVADHPSRVLSTSVPGIAIPDVKLDSTLQADSFQGIVFLGYDCQEFLPGGQAGEDTRRLLNDFQMKKRVVASMCAGQRILAAQGVLRGKSAAASQSVAEQEITVEGGQVVAEPVVVDGLVVTAAEATHSLEFLRAIRRVVR